MPDRYSYRPEPCEDKLYRLQREHKLMEERVASLDALLDHVQRKICGTSYGWPQWEIDDLFQRIDVLRKSVQLPRATLADPTDTK